MWVNLYFDCWRHFKKRPVIGNCIKFLLTIHGVLLVILQSMLIGWVIDIRFLIILMRLNKKRYIFYYCILNCGDNHTFDMYVSYLSFINFFLKISNHLYDVISVTILLKQLNNYIKFHFKYRSSSALEYSWFPLHLSRNCQTADQ